MEAKPRRFRIRLYQPDDHARVVELFVQGMLEYLEPMPEARRPSFEPMLNKYIEDSLADDLSRMEEVYFGRRATPKGCFWVVVEDVEVDGQTKEVVQGMVGLEYKSDEEAELRRMSVSRDARRQGLGHMLLDRLVEFAREQGFKRVVLGTGQHMPQANTLYSNYGFKRVKEDPTVVFYQYTVQQP